ncbi:MAG: hypothetical protein ACSHXY_05360 [Alphaproteobacteria bacterium]
MKTTLRYLLAWIAAVLACTITASIISTQRVINALNASGGAASFGDRVSMALYDLLHFGVLYGVFIVIAFLIAFIAGGFVFRFAKTGRFFVYITAGAVAMGVMLFLMKQVFFGVPIVGGARDGAGLALQMFAGGLGGYVFHRLSLAKSSA